MKRKTKKIFDYTFLLAILVLTIIFSGLLLFSQTRSNIGPGKSAMLPRPSSNSSFSPLCKTKNCVYAPILMYHHIAKKVPQDSYYVSPEILDQQFVWLSQNGYHVISLTDFYSAISGHQGLPTKPVVITFDDGNADNYTNAFPLLQKHKYNATFFVRTDMTGKPGYLSLSQIKSLSSAGMIIGSHTNTHPDLTKIDPNQLHFELADSRQILAQESGNAVQFLAYPGGAVNVSVETAAKKAGYLLAVTTSHKVYHTLYEDAFAVPRIHIDDEMPSFINWIQNINLK